MPCRRIKSFLSKCHSQKDRQVDRQATLGYQERADTRTKISCVACVDACRDHMLILLRVFHRCRAPRCVRVYVACAILIYAHWEDAFLTSVESVCQRARRYSLFARFRDQETTPMS